MVPTPFPFMTPTQPTYTDLISYFGEQTFQKVVIAGIILFIYVILNMFFVRTPKEKRKILKDDKIRDHIVSAFDVLALASALFIIILSIVGKGI